MDRRHTLRHNLQNDSQSSIVLANSALRRKFSAVDILYYVHICTAPTYTPTYFRTPYLLCLWHTCCAEDS